MRGYFAQKIIIYIAAMHNKKHTSLQATIAICIACVYLFCSFSPSPPVFTLYVFEGSDWCSNCRQAEKKILSDTGFVTYLQAENISIKRVDFPQRKKLPADVQKYNADLATRFDFDGSFPSFYLAGPDSATVKRIPYAGQNAQQFIDVLKQKIQAP